MISITSAQNPKLKKAIRLHESRGRKQQGRIIIFGLKEFQQAVDANIEITEVFTCPELSPATDYLSNLDRSIEHFELPSKLFQKLAFGHRNETVVAIANRPNTELKNFDAAQISLVLVLESVEKPGNIGAAFRSASAAGVEAIILANPISDVFHPNAIRSSLGSVFSIPVYCSPSDQCLNRLISSEFQIVATRVDAGLTYTTADLTLKSAIVLGSEAKGLSETWSGKNVLPVGIPMRDPIDSLNIAMTSTLMVYEARRQRILDERGKQADSQPSRR